MMFSDLVQLHRSVNRALLVFLWLHVPLIGGVAWMLGQRWQLLAGMAAAMAGAATAAWALAAAAKSTRLTIGVALIAMVSLLVAACEGAAWQGDLHMYYFAALAILGVYCDRDVVLMGAAMTALHHLGLNFLAPALVFPGGADVVRVGLHATIVLLETGALVWMATRIVALFRIAAENLATTVTAADRALAREGAEVEQQRLLRGEERMSRMAEQSAIAAAQEWVVAEIGAGLERLSGGNLAVRLSEPFAPAYEGLRRDFNSAAAQLRIMVEGIAANTSGLRGGIEAITQAAADLSDRTKRQAASLETVAGALDEITTRVRGTANGAEQTCKVVARAKADAEQSGQVMQEAVVAMMGIEASSRQMEQIVDMIDEISFQTNLLALNAGVEAARAGNAGRGFAVVASEVRALAQRSTAAAKEIKQLISQAALQVQSGAKLVAEGGQGLTRILGQVGEVDGFVGDIAVSAKDQAAGLLAVATALGHVDQTTQQNAAMVGANTAASYVLAQEVNELVRMTERFALGREREPKLAA